MRTIAAVDPGTNGAIVIRWPSGGVKAVKMPDSLEGVFEALQLALELGPAVLYLENVENVFGGCRTAQQGFSFGRGYGHIEMACKALDIKVVKVYPQAWQKPLNLGTIGKHKIPADATEEERAELELVNKGLVLAWKNRLVDLAKERFADHELGITKANADALLILAFAVGKELGTTS